MIQMDSVRVPQDQVKRGALLLAALLGVLAAWFLWSGVQQWRGHARETQLGSARDQVAQTVGSVLSDRTATLARQLDRAEVKAALAAGDASAAARAARSSHALACSTPPGISSVICGAGRSQVTMSPGLASMP